VIPRLLYKHMTPSPHTIGRDQSLAKAHELMRKFDIRHLPVLDGGVLVGIVSERDLRLVESVPGVDPCKALVEEAMTPEPYMASPDARLADVAREMVEHKYGCAVVMERGSVVGIFTTVDALRAVLDLEHELSSSYDDHRRVVA
jgi:acetoin utilization protein AcuB